MFQYVRKILNYQNTKRKVQQNTEVQSYYNESFEKNIEKNLTRIKGILGSNPDVVIREFKLRRKRNQKAAIILLEAMTNTDMINQNILKPLMFDSGGSDPEENLALLSIEDINDLYMPFCRTSIADAYGEAIDECLSGKTILLLDGSKTALLIGTKKLQTRSIEEPSTEGAIRGPREGFTESYTTNISLIRRRLKNVSLQFDPMKIGKLTKTDVAIAYIKGVVNPSIVEEVKDRLARIVTDSILDSGILEAFIEDSPYSVFNTVGNSERPDVIASRLLEGCVAIIADGSPFVLTVPLLFVVNFHAPGDNYIKFYFASIKRILRCISFIITIMVPSLYVALTTFHQELIPTKLLYTLAEGHQNIPFPSLLEAVVMLVIFDIMFEAGIRLPKAAGSAISIVGALVMGQSAVDAGLISPFMVIVVALTAISSFVVSAQSSTALILRYFFVVLGGTMGGFGITLGIVVVMVHMFSLKSFGISYLAPIYPYSSEDMKDSLLKAPQSKLTLRPKSYKPADRVRQKSLE